MAAGLILLFLAIKMATKFVGILPLTRAFAFHPREGMYTTLLMSTGLTFGSISALFGLSNGVIDQRQYTILVTAVIGSAVVPTLIAQRWFMPAFTPIEAARVAPATACGTTIASSRHRGRGGRGTHQPGGKPVIARRGTRRRCGCATSSVH